MDVFKVWGSIVHVLVSIVYKRNITYASDKTIYVNSLTFTAIYVDVEFRKFGNST